MYTLLFFDDWHLHSRTNLQRRVGSPKLIEEATFHDPHVDVAWGFPTVLWDEESGKWRCYYQGELAERGKCKVPLMAESEDGVRWEIPDLSDRVDLPNREAPHQVYAGHMHEWCHVYDDPNAHGTDQRFKSLASRPAGPLSVESFLLASPDGLCWHAVENVRWHPTGVDPGQFIFWNPYRQSYVLSIRPYVGDRRQAICETTDWKTFTEPELALQPDALDTPSALFYGMPVVPYDQMFIGMLWVYHTDPSVYRRDKFLTGRLQMQQGDDISRIMGKVDCQLVYSINGWHFQRSLREPFIPNGAPGEPGSGCIYPSSVVPHADVLRIYSSASQGEHAQLRNDPASRQSAITLHEMRKDGFIYLEPPGGTGEFTTKWMLWDRGELSINVSAPHGELLVQVMDTYNEPLEGYSYEECAPFTGDSQSWSPRWRDGRGMAALRGRIVRLGVRLANGRIYAMRGEFEFKTMCEAHLYMRTGVRPPSRPAF